MEKEEEGHEKRVFFLSKKARDLVVNDQSLKVN